LEAPTLLRINELDGGSKLTAGLIGSSFQRGSAPVSLAGLYLTDDSGKPSRFRIPELSFAGTGPRGGFTLFIADYQTLAGANHVNFRLEASGGIHRAVRRQSCVPSTP